ncbi:MAG: YceD family protein [Stellaceae bacterium]
MIAIAEATPEFSRPVRLAGLGSAPFCQQIEASATERERLARRLDLVALDRLTATVTLCRRDGGTIVLEAVLEAGFSQECVVTLEPVAGTVRQEFTLLYGPVGEDQAEIEIGVEETVFEPLNGDSIDIGEAVAQELSLALPEFPRHPDAAAAETIDAAAADAIEPPFAALARWRTQPRD